MSELPKTLSLDDIGRTDPFLGSTLKYISSMYNAETYLVGGYLRDYFLGEIPEDIDFITSADPEDTASRVAARWEGKSFCLYEEERTYRVVVETQGGAKRTLDFAPIKGQSLEDDLTYRDFTINAMAVDVERLIDEGCLRLPRDLLDKHYGWRDLDRRILRECSNESFLMDPVRLVRALRFRHILGMEYEERTLNHMKKYAPLITKAPGERVAVELMETLSYPRTSEIFSELEFTGLLQYLFPDLTDTVGLEQNAYHHLDVWSHTLLTMDELDRLLSRPEDLFPDYSRQIREHMSENLQHLFKRSSFLRLAALYHDTGKADTVSADEAGRIHFYGHQKCSEEAAKELSERLCLSRRAGGYLEKIVGRHMDIGFAADERVTPRVMRKLVVKLGDELVDIVLLSTADRLATRGPLSTQEGLREFMEFCGMLLGEYFREKELAPLLKGGDIMEELDIPEGPVVGEILAEVRGAQLEGAVSNREEALGLARDIVIRRIGDSES